MAGRTYLCQRHRTNERQTARTDNRQIHLRVHAAHLRDRPDARDGHDVGGGPQIDLVPSEVCSTSSNASTIFARGAGSLPPRSRSSRSGPGPTRNTRRSRRRNWRGCRGRRRRRARAGSCARRAWSVRSRPRRRSSPGWAPAFSIGDLVLERRRDEHVDVERPELLVVDRLAAGEAVDRLVLRE